jgi:toxin ParE1/3/4
MLDTLAEEIFTLDQFPYRAPLTKEEPWHSQGVHALTVKNFLVYFWVDEEAKKVQVMGIVYGRRDQRHQLSGLDLFC